MRLAARTIETNLTGHVTALLAFGEAMRRRGSGTIVVLSSAGLYLAEFASRRRQGILRGCTRCWPASRRSCSATRGLCRLRGPVPLGYGLLPAVLVRSVLAIPYITKSAETSLTHAPVGYLPYAIWAFYGEPTASSVDLSYDAALLLFVIVLLLIAVGRMVVALSRRHAE